MVANARKLLIVGAVWLSACASDDAGKSGSRQAVLSGDAGSASNPQSGSAAPDGGWSYTTTGRALGLDARPLSLCEVAAERNAGVAFYTVDSLTSYNEPDVGESVDIYTYVQLTKVEDLGDGNAPSSPVARVRGGVHGDLATSIDVTLTVGELDAIFLGPATDDNEGFYSIGQFGFFSILDGGYTNLQLFTESPADRATIEAAFRKVGPHRCDQNVYPAEYPGLEVDAGAVGCDTPSAAIAAVANDSSLLACATDDDCTVMKGVAFDCAQVVPNVGSQPIGDVAVAKSSMYIFESHVRDAEDKYCIAYAQLLSGYAQRNEACASVLGHRTLLKAVCTNQLCSAPGP